MNLLLIVGLSFVIVLAILLPLWPLLRRETDGCKYFIHGRRADEERRRYRRQLLEGIRDLQIEKEQGKLNEEELYGLAGPFLAALERSERSERSGKETSAPLLSARGRQRPHLSSLSLKERSSGRSPAGNRRGWFCPLCGELNPAAPPQGAAAKAEIASSANEKRELFCRRCGGR